MSTDAPKPTPRPGVPTPAAIKPHAPAAAPAATPVAASSNSVTFGRVADDGTVFVRTPDGEKEVGSYPDATHEEALAYFARKYDELAASANLLLQRVVQTDLSTQDGQAALKSLREQVLQANVVGDLPALDNTVEQIATALAAKAEVESKARAEAKKESAAKREELVAEAEKIASQPVEKVQWKQSTARMRELLDEWKTLQHSQVRLDKETEHSLWTRFSAARNGFDKTRRTHFAKLDEEHSSAKATKQKLVEEAEKLSESTEWGPTAGAFKRLMSEWKRAGRASRADDDALWAKFKAAQDAFFNAKDEVAAAENVEFEANLKVKEELLTQAQALVPIKDLEKAKKDLHAIQDKWDAAGKVPRKDIERMERGMRKVEQTIREAENKQWKKTDPELAARAGSFAQQLQRAVSDLQDEITAAEAKGDDKKAAKLREELKTKQTWLDQAMGGLKEFGS
ncbi:DUF349 domain-containing protein [Yimella sp. NH-Cas1]|uniref:DUF349 domain-containing protein n=1 Tax=Yimella sp. NH-Cas1 TaxID=2917726 RepID=UPI001EFAF628|nr:DUF349 domain-containing protein [Yimella sp. NH-Cas1]MCG8655447.1 DUF349 domain-containing protein [Yimella sp. NH-Cas1]